MSAAIGLAKELVGINKAVDEATWKLKTAELTSALADAKMGVTEQKRKSMIETLKSYDSRKRSRSVGKPSKRMG